VEERAMILLYRFSNTSTIMTSAGFVGEVGRGFNPPPGDTGDPH